MTFYPPWKRDGQEIACLDSHNHTLEMNPKEITDALSDNNVSFQAKDLEHGRQFRFDDGAILIAYNTGALVWQGKKETPTVVRVKKLIGGNEPPRIVAGREADAAANKANNKVFVVYGHDTNAREQLELLLRRMKLEPVILQNIPIAGDTIIEKLESNLDVKYACVLLTPDDIGHAVDAPKDKKFRARQNVILELGMFLVRLGRKRVAILHKGDMELPSDIAGLIYIKFKNRVDEVKEKLGAELQEAGFPINIKDLLG